MDGSLAPPSYQNLDAVEPSKSDDLTGLARNIQTGSIDHFGIVPTTIAMMCLQKPTTRAQEPWDSPFDSAFEGECWMESLLR